MYYLSPAHDYGQNTNVVKLFAKIDLETTHPEQYAYYSSGIGTRPKSLHVFNRVERAVSDKFDMAVAWFVRVIHNSLLFDGMKYLMAGIWRKLSRMRMAGWHEHIKKGIRYTSLVGLVPRQVSQPIIAV